MQLGLVCLFVPGHRRKSQGGRREISAGEGSVSYGPVLCESPTFFSSRHSLHIIHIKIFYLAFYIGIYMYMFVKFIREDACSPLCVSAGPVATLQSALENLLVASRVSPHQVGLYRCDWPLPLLAVILFLLVSGCGAACLRVPLLLLLAASDTSLALQDLFQTWRREILHL